MSAEVLSEYIDELLAGNEAPIEEYLLRHPEDRKQLASLLATALAAHEAIEAIEVDADGAARSKARVVAELEKHKSGPAPRRSESALRRARDFLRRLKGRH